jgi:hypothetical protein
MKTMPCPICRKLIILKDYFTYDECNKYFSLMPDEYQKRFIRKHTLLLKYNFTDTVINVNEEAIPQSKNVMCQDFTFLIVVIFIFLAIIASSVFI